MSNVFDPARYLTAVLAEFDDDCQALAGFELKRRLWKCAVIVFENAPNPSAYLAELEHMAHGAGLRPSAVLTTFRSAQRRASR